MITRSALLGVALLRTNAHRPPAPLKLNLCLTYWCQYRCKTCNIWQRKPTDELTTEEIVALVRENPNVNWVDLTGGEIFLRPRHRRHLRRRRHAAGAGSRSCISRPTGS